MSIKMILKVNELEQLKKQFGTQNLSVKSGSVDNLHLPEKLWEKLEEITMVAKESSEPRIQESLKMERDQFRTAIKKKMITIVYSDSSPI
jgi:hypothetical protein